MYIYIFLNVAFLCCFVHTQTLTAPLFTCKQETMFFFWLVPLVWRHLLSCAALRTSGVISFRFISFIFKDELGASLSVHTYDSSWCYDVVVVQPFAIIYAFLQTSDWPSHFILEGRLILLIVHFPTFPLSPPAEIKSGLISNLSPSQLFYLVCRIRTPFGIIGRRAEPPCSITGSSSMPGCHRAVLSHVLSLSSCFLPADTNTIRSFQPDCLFC